VLHILRRLRTLRRRIRRRVLALARWARRRRRPLCRTAASLRLPLRTLSRWRQNWRRTGLTTRPQGRPQIRASRGQRSAVLSTLVQIGPHAGLPTLRACHAGLAPAVLARIQRRFRRVWRRRQRTWQTRLRWTTAGTVWAMDFTRPDRPIDGVHRRVLVVRDLASGFTLLALPCRSECALVVSEALAGLFALHGPPLVLKSDNGSAFVEQHLQRLLAENSVLQLFSPPCWPRYNGTCERGLGWLKVRARHLAQLDLRPDTWSSSDLARARAVANELSRPKGWDKPSPAQAWNARAAITPQQRRALCESRDRQLAAFCAAECCDNRTLADAVRESRITLPGSTRPGAGGLNPLPPGPAPVAPVKLSKHETASRERRALAGALVDLGFLCFWKRRFTPPIKPGKRAIN